MDGNCIGCATTVAANSASSTGAQLAGDRSGSQCQQAAMHTLSRRLDAMRAFKECWAAGDLHAVLEVMSRNKDCWGQQDMERFRLLLEKAAGTSTNLQSDAARQLISRGALKLQ